MDDDTRHRLLRVFQRHFAAVSGQPRFPMEEPLVALGLNSVKAVHLLLDLEQTFGVSFPGSLLNAKTFRSAASLESAIRTLIRE